MSTTCAWIARTKALIVRSNCPAAMSLACFRIFSAEIEDHQRQGTESEGVARLTSQHGGGLLLRRPRLLRRFRLGLGLRSRLLRLGGLLLLLGRSVIVAVLFLVVLHFVLLLLLLLFLNRQLRIRLSERLVIPLDLGLDEASAPRLEFIATREFEIGKSSVRVRNG